MFRRICFIVTVAALLLAVVNAQQPEAPRPPVCPPKPKKIVLHDEFHFDNYFWLRDRDNPEVRRYLEAENAYTDAVMKPTAKVQEDLYKEILGRIKQTDLSVPARTGPYWYYTRTVEGKQYPIYCRKKGTLEAPEEITLDANELAKGQRFLSIAEYSPSDDHNLLAYATDTTGFRDYTLFVKDLRSGQLLPDQIRNIAGAEWAADNQHIFYVAEDQAKRPYRLYRHKLGTPQVKDELVYEEKDELYRLGIGRSLDKKFLIAISASLKASECRYLPSDQPTGAFKVVLPREMDHEYYIEHRQGQWFIRTNKDAKQFKLVTCHVDQPAPANWKEIIPHRPNVMLEDVNVFADHLVVSERADGLQRMIVIDLKSNEQHAISFPETTYNLAPSGNPEFNTTTFRYSYQSFQTPPSVFEYDLVQRTAKLLKATEVLGGYDPQKYKSERIFATASDGTKVPISLVYRSDVKRDGTAPLYLTGYGAYGIPADVHFSPARISLLDRGIVYALAHVRGGGEFGEIWHDAGRMMNKKNTFTDFIAAADHLVAQKYGARERLVIRGGSAGGLLIGAVVNFRPDLCKAAVLEVPFVDVINTMLDDSLPLTFQEFLEWGNPKVKKEYDYMKSYCPYTNLAAKAYPAILVRTSLNDSQVMYWEPAKYVAKLRSLRTDDNVLLLKTNMAAGHGGASGRYDALREEAFLYAFVLNQMGIKE
jgi:oligopeptidase B